MAPGIEVLSGEARLAGSEPAGNGRKFTVEVLVTADVKLSIRTLDTDTGPGGAPAHVHSLDFAHPTKTFVANPGDSESEVPCPQGYAAIVGSYDLPDGLVALGLTTLQHSHQIWLRNTTQQTREAKLDVECVGLRTAGTAAETPVVNTATTDTTTSDPSVDNDHDSATIGVSSGAVHAAAAAASHHRLRRLLLRRRPDRGRGGQQPRTPAHGAGPGPTRRHPWCRARTTTAPVGPSGSRWQRAAQRERRALTVPVSCTLPKTCSGKVTVTARPPAKLRSVSAKPPKKLTLGQTTYRIKPGKSASIRVTIAKRYRSLLRSGRIRSVTITAGTKTVTRKIVIPAKSK